MSLLRIGETAPGYSETVVGPDSYEELLIENGYRIDLLVGDSVVVELKSVPSVLDIHKSPLLSYLRLGGFKLGLLLNFNVLQMRDGIVRMVNGL